MSRSHAEVSQKHENFTKSAMGNKSIEEVPGIGQVYGADLRAKNVDTAKKLYAHFILKDERGFKKLVGGNQGTQSAAYNAMKDWDEANN